MSYHRIVSQSTQGTTSNFSPAIVSLPSAIRPSNSRATFHRSMHVNGVVVSLCDGLGLGRSLGGSWRLTLDLYAISSHSSYLLLFLRGGRLLRACLFLLNTIVANGPLTSTASLKQRLKNGMITPPKPPRRSCSSLSPSSSPGFLGGALKILGSTCSDTPILRSVLIPRYWLRNLTPSLVTV